MSVRAFFMHTKGAATSVRHMCVSILLHYALHPLTLLLRAIYCSSSAGHERFTLAAAAVACATVIV